MRSLAWVFLLFLGTPVLAQNQGQGNRFAYLDEVDPYYPSRTFPKLVTPQWVGEDGVEAVVILSTDDMHDHKRYETFLRPILNRLKKIDGRAPVSIMTCKIDPREPHLEQWLKEGLSIECHTIDHPWPFFKNGFARAKESYDKCVDLLHQIPNTKPVAFRMPCCDSLNTPSPRFFAEIFNKVTPSPPGGEGRVRGNNFLQIDSSVFNVFTSADPDLPRELVLDEQGRERFKRFLPADRSFVNTIENYPYPYVIGRLCWEFPCVTPSDWQAQHLQKPNNPRTVEDWKAALDCTVIKQGVFCLVFHPHGWIKNDQVVEFIDYAVKKHGKKVKFLTFKEAQERLNKNFLGPDAFMRDRITGLIPDVAIQPVSLCGDELIDVFFYSQKNRSFFGKVWKKKNKSWVKTETIELEKTDAAFGITSFSGMVSFWRTPLENQKKYFLIMVGYSPEISNWRGDRILQLPFSSKPERYLSDKDRVVFLDNGDIHLLETILDSPKMAYRLPLGSHLDPGLRFLDLDGDGKLDIIFSNEKEYGIYLFENMEKGWSKKILHGKRNRPGVPATGELPMISRNGTNNGFWVHSGYLWWSNEDTVNLPDHVDRRSIKQLLGR